MPCEVSLKDSADTVILRKGIAPKDIISSAVIDGKVLEPETLSFGGSGEPELIFRRINDTFTCFVSVYLGDALLALPPIAEILKGDVNMDGRVNAVDASLVLRCYAQLSVGSKWNFTPAEDGVPENLLKERMAYLAADIDTESPNMCSEEGCKIDSIDASKILAYYSLASSGQNAEW